MVDPIALRVIEDAMAAVIRAMAPAREGLVRELLSRWVSEIPPALAIDQDGGIIGLTPEDTPVGVKGFILTL